MFNRLRAMKAAGAGGAVEIALTISSDTLDYNILLIEVVLTKQVIVFLLLLLILEFILAQPLQEQQD